jgi:diacylglycerol kinase
MQPEKFSIKSRFGSFKFAFRGLKSMLKNEHNSRIHLLAAIIALTLAIILKINRDEWSLLIIVIGVVFITELLNSSIEALADLVDNEWNEKIKISKDYAAAAVFISALIAVVIGGLIFIPKILFILSKH